MSKGEEICQKEPYVSFVRKLVFLPDGMCLSLDDFIRLGGMKAWDEGKFDKHRRFDEYGKEG